MISILSVLLAGWLVWVARRVLKEIREPVEEGDRIILRLGNQEQAVEWFIRGFVSWVRKNRSGLGLLINVDAQDDTRKIIEILCRDPGYAVPVKIAGVDYWAGRPDAAEGPGRREFDARRLSNKELIGFSFDRLVSFA